MSRGSFGRTVARAAASGGSKNYRSRPPALWYMTLLAIVIVGCFLIVYSRNEGFQRATASSTATAPTKTDNWYTALGFDICGKSEPNLAANTNLSTVGIRTFGDGIINTDPGSAKTPSDYTGAHATLGTFVTHYGDHLAIGTRSLHLPGKKGKSYSDGGTCPSTSGKDAGKKASVLVEVWSSSTGTGALATGSPSAIRLKNGEMIVVAFVPPGSTIPAPPSEKVLLQDLETGSPTSSTGATSTTTTGTKSTATTTTVPATTKKK